MGVTVSTIAAAQAGNAVTSTSDIALKNVAATSSAVVATSSPGAGATPVVADGRGRLPPPTGTIHWAVKRDGSVELSDRPVAGPSIVKQGVETYRTASDTESLARAKTEREYWHSQSEAFDKRQEQRDRDLETRRQQAALARAEQTAYAGAPYYYGAYGARYGAGYGYGYGGHGGPGSPPPGAGFGNNGQYAVGGGAPGLGSPEAAALGGGPSPFLSSGFARNLRR